MVVAVATAVVAAAAVACGGRGVGPVSEKVNEIVFEHREFC